MFEDQLHVSEVEGDGVGLEEVVAGAAGAKEAERVFHGEGAVVNARDVFLFDGAEGEQRHDVGDGGEGAAATLAG